MGYKAKQELRWKSAKNWWFRKCAREKFITICGMGYKAQKITIELPSYHIAELRVLSYT